MRPGDPDAAATALAALLEEERTALQAGALDQLAELGARKAALVDRLAAGAMPPSDATGLAAAAERNQKLLAAAAEGVRTAHRRVCELRTLAAGGGTYDASGQRQTGSTPPRLARRW